MQYTRELPLSQKQCKSLFGVKQHSFSCQIQNILPSIGLLTLEYMYRVDEFRSAFDILLGLFIQTRSYKLFAVCRCKFKHFGFCFELTVYDTDNELHNFEYTIT